jgi:putative SOS response-associated peptidase YedK
MCGRFAQLQALAVLAERFGALCAPAACAMTAPRYNIAPGQPVLAVRADESGGRCLLLLHWGLIPPWAEDPKAGARMINARAETLAAKPAFRRALRERRCLIPADGFYEWRRTGKHRQPFFVSLKSNQPAALAGLWESWESPGGARIESCAIVTVPANELIAPIHARMPAILPPEAQASWLASDARLADAACGLLEPYPAAAMRAYAVGTRVNSALHEGPECLRPAVTLQEELWDGMSQADVEKTER